MRLRLLLPRGGRGRGLGGLTTGRRSLAGGRIGGVFVARWLIGAGVLVCALLLASCGGSASVEGPAAPPPDHGSLAVGITEPNASLIVSPRARPDLPQPFAAFRDRLVSLRPRYYRLFVRARTSARLLLIADTLKGADMTEEIRQVIIEHLGLPALAAAGRQAHIAQEEDGEKH